MIVILDSGVANLASVAAAFARLDVSAEISSDPQRIAQAERVILPGVGAAPAALRSLAEKGLIETVKNLRQPVLGICLGMQLLYGSSEEGGSTPCLGLVPGQVRKLQGGGEIRIPHMGWNNLHLEKPDHPLLHGIEEGTFFYFVHSFAAPLGEATLASADHGQAFTAVCGHKNFFGCQFHPERSGAAGAKILRNFIAMRA